MLIPFSVCFVFFSSPFKFLVLVVAQIQIRWYGFSSGCLLAVGSKWFEALVKLSRYM